jgi:predicted small metal-binding protein
VQGSNDYFLIDALRNSAGASNRRRNDSNNGSLLKSNKHCLWRGKKEAEIMDANSKEYKELSCRDFKSDCGFMVRAETSEELMKYCQEHACSVHGKCGSSPESREKIKSHIKDVWV